MSITKKFLYTTVVFCFFLLFLEGVLSLIPVLLGFQQRGQYDRIMEGGSTIICLGDSVTYGYGLEPEESWPKQLETLMHTGGANISVINRAVSGMDSTEALQRELHTIEDISQKGSRPVVLLMIGHNDLAGHGWRQWSTPATVPEQNQAPPPRLWRILRWSQHTGQKSDWKSPKKEIRLQENILQLDQKIAALGGKLYLLTYLLPGEGEKSNPRYAKDIALSIALQGRGNQVLRELHRENDIGIIDVELSITSPESWDPSWFQDHIHPTAYASTEIAKTVQKHLVSYGEFPLSVLP